MAYNFLLVDDSSIVRKVLKKNLQLTDLEINELFEAGNGQQALELLKHHWVDLIFLDINMPVMDGIEFMRHLRAEQTTQDLPVLIVSTEGSQERRTLLNELGISGYQRKPFTPEQFFSTVVSILGEIGK